MNKFGLLSVLLFVTLHLHSQKDSSDKKVKILPVPTFGYSPETKTYVGAVALFNINLYADSLTRTSTASIEFNYTWRKQYILEGEWDYFFKEEKWFSKGRIHFSKFPDLYYGIGNHTKEENETNYNSNRTILELSGLKNIGKSWFTGLFLKYLNYKNVSYTSDEFVYPELESSTTVGIAFSVLKDSRNNILTPTDGFYLLTNVGIGSSEELYPELTIDARVYKKIRKKITFAFRLLNDFNLETPPFYEMAHLGGDRFVRGYYYGRFRDKNLSTFQTEVRGKLFWRIGAAAFGGISNTFPNSENFNMDKIKPNYGAGLRFLIDKENNTSLRLDYALGENENSGFYVSFGESF